MRRRSHVAPAPRCPAARHVAVRRAPRPGVLSRQQRSRAAASARPVSGRGDAGTPRRGRCGERPRARARTPPAAPPARRATGDAHRSPRRPPCAGRRRLRWRLLAGSDRRAAEPLAPSVLHPPAQDHPRRTACAATPARVWTTTGRRRCRRGVTSCPCAAGLRGVLPGSRLQQGVAHGGASPRQRGAATRLASRSRRCKVLLQSASGGDRRWGPTARTLVRSRGTARPTAAR